MKSSTPEVALAWQGLQHWSEAYRSGNWQPYMKLLTDNYTFRVVSGKKLSKAWDVQSAYQLQHQLSNDREALSLDQPVRTLQQDNTVVFEFENDRQEFGAAFSFDLHGDKIAACRAYLCLQ